MLEKIGKRAQPSSVSNHASITVPANASGDTFTMSRGAKYLGCALVGLASLRTSFAGPAGAGLAFQSLANDTLGDIIGDDYCGRSATTTMWDMVKDCGAEQLSSLPNNLVMTALQGLPPPPYACGLTIRVTNATSSLASCIVQSLGRFNGQEQEYWRRDAHEASLVLGLGLGLPALLGLSICLYQMVRQHSIGQTCQYEELELSSKDNTEASWV